jgi:DNA-binding phage protein
MHSRTPLARWFRQSGSMVSSVAREVGVSRVSLYHYVNASRTPNPQTILRLTKLTGLDADQLVRRAKRARKAA